jgi:hypothetical protein
LFLDDVIQKAHLDREIARDAGLDNPPSRLPPMTTFLPVNECTSRSCSWAVVSPHG